MANFFTKAKRRKILSPGYRYQPSESEIDEVTWLIDEGIFSSVEEYIESVSRDHVKIALKEEAAEKKRKV